MYNGNHLNDFYLSDWPQTDRHTQKEMDLVGLYSALQLGMEGELRVTIWPGTWPPRAVYRLALVELGVRGRERGSLARALQHNLSGGTQTHDPESNESTILAARIDDRRHEHHEAPPPRPPPPRAPARSPTTKEPRTRPPLRQLATLLIPPLGRWRDPL